LADWRARGDVQDWDVPAGVWVCGVGRGGGLEGGGVGWGCGDIAVVFVCGTMMGC